VTGVNMALRRQSDNILLASGTATPQATHFEAGGSVNVPIGVHYDQAQGGSAATLTITVSATDDNGNAVSAILAVPVTAAA